MIDENIIASVYKKIIKKWKIIPSFPFPQKVT